MPTFCWLQALAVPTLAAQESRAPGALNNSLLQHLHSSSSPLPFPSPATPVLVPPSLGTGGWEDALSISGHRHKDLPALHCKGEEKSLATHQ